MKHLSKIVWSEGMHLGPHQFQAQATFFENAVDFTNRLLRFAPYGLAGYDLDVEALRNGTVSLVHARGVFPDGLPFHMPECDALPPARNIIEDFPPTHERLTVSLGVPAQRPGERNCSLSETEPHQNAVRYAAEQRSLRDSNTGADERPVQLGRKKIRLVLENEPAEGLVCLPLARVARGGAGGFVYDDNFVPPCLQMDASPRLMTLTGRLIDVLQDKSSALASTVQGKRSLQSGLSARQVMTFWFLHALNSHLAPLQHLHRSKRGHPEELFVEMLRLGGALCTFSLDARPETLPLYDHDRLDDCFTALEDHIRRLLEIMLPSNCLSIALRPSARQYFWDGPVSDQRCFGRSRWIFAIHSPMGETHLIRQVPLLVKICSEKFVPELVRRAIPGLTLTHISNPPAAIAPKVGTQYFVIDQSGPCWEHLMQTKHVGIYAPGDIPQPEMELLVLLES